MNESEQLKCWAIHVIGRDELLPAPSKKIAQFVCDVMNRWANGRPDKNEYDQDIRFEVIEWTGGYELWKVASEQFTDRWCDWLNKNCATINHHNQ